MTPQQSPFKEYLKDVSRRRTTPEENNTDEWNASIKRMEERKAENDRLAREANASRFEHNNGNNHPNPTKKKPEKKPRGRFGVVLAEVVENPDISMQARALYAIIAASFHKDTEMADLSISALMTRSGMSRKQVKRLSKELQDAGVLQKLSTGNQRSKWKIGSYTTLPRVMGDPTPRVMGDPHTREITRDKYIPAQEHLENLENQNPETQNPETQNLEGVDREQGETISPDQMGRPPLTRCDACPTFRASGHCDALPAAP